MNGIGGGDQNNPFVLSLSKHVSQLSLSLSHCFAALVPAIFPVTEPRSSPEPLG